MGCFAAAAADATTKLLHSELGNEEERKIGPRKIWVVMRLSWAIFPAAEEVRYYELSLFQMRLGKKTSVGYECHAWNVRPLCLRWKWMSLLWSIFFVQVQDHICIACVKCGITRSSKSLIHMVWKLLKMSHLNFGIFHHFLCDFKIDLSLTLFDRKLTIFGFFEWRSKRSLAFLAM